MILPASRFLVTALLLSALSPFLLSSARAQELEPRSLTNVPVGMNFVVVGYALSSGNVAMDPALPIEGLNATINSGVFAFARAIDFFGLGAKVDAVVPVATAHWTAVVFGRDSSRTANGFGDPRVRFSVTLIGAPALHRAQFRDYRPGTVVGASLQVWVPIGEYDPARVLNLGSHRWTFKPQLGVSQALGRWIVEAYAALWLYGTNGDFYGGSTLEQKPFLTGKLHLIRKLPKGFWVTLDGGIGAGGRTIIDGEPSDNYQSCFRVGFTVAAPLARQHTLKLSAYTTERIDAGPDYNFVSLFYQFNWGG